MCVVVRRCQQVPDQLVGAVKEEGLPCSQEGVGLAEVPLAPDFFTRTASAENMDGDYSLNVSIADLVRFVPRAELESEADVAKMLCTTGLLGNSTDAKNLELEAYVVDSIFMQGLLCQLQSLMHTITYHGVPGGDPLPAYEGLFERITTDHVRDACQRVKGVKKS